MKIPPAYSSFKYLYPGVHIDNEGKIDLRVRFAIPLFNDTLEPDLSAAEIASSKYTYLIFPFGAGENEIEEETFDLSELLWTG